MGSAIPIPIVDGGSSSAGQFYDFELSVTTGASAYKNWQITKQFGAFLENTTPGIADLDENGMVERISNGTAVIRCFLGEVFSTLRLSVTQSGGSTINGFSGFVPGSVSDVVSSEIIDLMEHGGDLPLFTLMNHVAATYSKNPTSWVSDIDLSGIAVALATNGSNWDQGNAPVNITSRHGVIVRHWQTCIKNVSKARFVGNDGTIHERTITGISAPFKNGSLTDDLIVVAYDSPLPESVAPFALAGEWLRQDVADTGINRQFPGEFFSGGIGLTINQNHEALAVALGNGIQLSQSSILRGVTYNGESIPTIIGSMQLASGDSAKHAISGAFDNLEEFLKPIITGDSGKPVFVIVDSKALLVMNYTYSNLGPFIGVQNGTVANALILNADIDAGINTGYTVTVAPDPTP